MLENDLTFLGLSFLIYRMGIITIVIGTSPLVQWVRHHTPNAGGPGSIPGVGTKSWCGRVEMLSHV